MDISVVIPCLNESETLRICIDKAKKQIEKLGIKGEIIISDNGSTDGSQNLAKQMGAKVIHTEVKGYGSAVRNGIKNSDGKFILIADGDDSYNFDDLPKFYNEINNRNVGDIYLCTDAKNINTNNKINKKSNSGLKELLKKIY